MSRREPDQVKLTHKPPPVAGLVSGMRGRYKKALYDGAQASTDKASRAAQAGVKSRMLAARLGRLAGAVGQTSSLKKRQTPKQPYGVIFARGGDTSRAGQALEAYSQGATIRAGPGKEWLAFATTAVPRTIGRRKITPALYNASGLRGTIGPLQFRPVSRDLAYLVVRNVTLHPRTYRAKAAGKRAPRTRVPAKEVIAFVLIRVTRRAKRFDKDTEVRREAGQVPRYMAEFLELAFAGQTPR